VRAATFGRDTFGGYCCFNDVALCIVNLRERHGFRRFAILDTDAHHGDGTRPHLFAGDPDILHVCLCGARYESPDGTKVDVPSHDYRSGGRGDRPANDAYLDLVTQEFPTGPAGSVPTSSSGISGSTRTRGLRRHRPDGSLLLEHRRLMRDLAGEVCGGRIEVVLGGGSHTRPGHLPDPAVIELLAGLQ